MIQTNPPIVNQGFENKPCDPDTVPHEIKLQFPMIIIRQPEQNLSIADPFLIALI